MATKTFHAIAGLALCALQPALAQVERPEQITYPPLAEFEIPKPSVHTLPNGLTVLLLEDHELPAISATALLRAGGLLEPADKTGLAGIVGQTLRTGGTASRTGDELDELLESRAASIEAGVGEASANVSLDCLAPDFPVVFAAFAEVLRSPQFAEDKLELAKVQAKSGIARRNDNVQGIAGREFRRALYGPDTAIGRQPEYATIAAITREDLVAFHAAYFHPNDTILGVVGDFDSKLMLRTIEKTLGDWEKGPVTPKIVATPAPAGKPRVLSIVKQDVNQAQLRLGHLGITYDAPDFFAVEVMNEVLGGGFSGRLFKTVRSEKGLAYAVGGGVRAGFAYPGLAALTISTKFATVGAAVDALLEEIDKMRAAPPTADEMARAKESILNGFVFNYASKAQVLSQWMLFRYQGLPDDWLERYRERIETVTAEQVHQAAIDRLRPDEIVLLVVGDPAQYDRPLSEFGTVEDVDITIPVPPPTTPAVESTAESTEAGRAVLDRVAAALGGPDPDAVEAIRSEATLTLSMGGQEISLARTTLTVFPERIRTDLSTPMGAQVVVLDGDQGWMAMGGQHQALPAEQIAEQRRDLGRDLRTIVRYVADPELEAIAAGTVELDGVAHDRLVVRYRGAETTLLVAPDGTVARQLYAGKNPATGAPGEFEIEILDYRELDGRLVPHSQVVRVDGELIGRSTLSRFVVNPEVDEALFAPPAP